MRSEGIDLRMNFSDVPDIMIDPGQISQVVLNFIINAKHALIKQEEKIIEISTGVDNAKSFIAVRDSGCGIPKENITKMFLPFFSTKGEHASSGSIHSVVKGTGLGLSVCDSIARNHNGEIIVDSEIGKGSTFTLWLPLEGTDKEFLIPERDLEYENEEIAENLSGNIIVIDDEEDVQDLLCCFLAKEGYHVRSTDDGQEALGWVVNSKCDAILLDLQMPNMAGTDFLRALNKLSLPKPEVIIITGKYTEENLEECEKIGVFKIVKKPFDVNDISHMVAAAVKHAREVTIG
jgi:two-component system cell cycle sensor histidine kinase/response regulator CckA